MKPSKTKSSGKKTILFAVTGTTPAVLTETVWALAQEKPAILPDRVVVVTTTVGKKQIEGELFGEAGVWDALRKAVKAGDKLCFGTTATDIRVFTSTEPKSGRSLELDDLRTARDNASAADFILEQLRGLAENPDTRIIASIAGGRKTMGALLYACMSLIGREGDRLTHVLVNGPYENPKLLPRFYFPGCGPSLKDAGGIKPVVELADMPFVPLRNRFMDLRNMPGSFGAMVGKYSRQIKNDGTRKVVVRLDSKTQEVMVDGVEAKLSPKAFGVLMFLMNINQREVIPKKQSEAIPELRQFLKEKSIETSWLPKEDPFGKAESVDTQELRKMLYEIRKVFTNAGITWQPGDRSQSLRLPPFTSKKQVSPGVKTA
jgi:CRISPR-associated protein (TIGR02584 family)